MILMPAWSLSPVYIGYERRARNKVSILVLSRNGPRGSIFLVVHLLIHYVPRIHSNTSSNRLAKRANLVLITPCDHIVAFFRRFNSGVRQVVCLRDVS